MITIALSEVSDDWPRAEKALATEQEVILTRNGKAVARLAPLASEEPFKREQKRFDPVAHKKWQEEVFGKGVTVDWVKKFIEERGD